MLAKMFERWQEWMYARGSARMISRPNEAGDGVEDYLERFYLLKIAGRALFLHRFYRSDILDLHDHPWDWGHVVVRGGYYEHHLDGTEVWHGVGNPWWSFVLRVHAEVMHRVELEPKRAEYAWTLFWHGKRYHRWGFMVDGAWVAARDSGNENMQKTVGFVFPRKVRDLRDA